MITKKQVHKNCNVEVQLSNKLPHYASLVCTDTNCKRKRKHVQWLNKADVAELQQLGLAVKETAE